MSKNIYFAFILKLKAIKILNFNNKSRLKKQYINLVQILLIKTKTVKNSFN